ncbi:tetratricopeptide repeat protein, partial [uncultured Desulfovibrio sp.]|uniref:tetratricopeptide repeat protein n=1 Tax=uncultured Desulfovibrio sp. TaxID=167968 RepID=UPI0026280C41
MQLNTPHAPSAAPSKPVEVRGVFSTQEIRRVGTGTTTRKTVQKTFWFVEQKGQDIECQPLNPNYIPSGPKRKISMDELIAKFSPEPEFYMNSVYPKMQELKKTISSADRQRENGNNFTAEYEYSRALKVDEENVRANFGIGLTYLERGDKAKAQDIFERLVKLDGAFQAEHKHLFNDFGINLRKNKMLTQALEYYKRAQELSPNDENLYMNIARVQLENHNIDDCIANLLKALSLDPHHAPSLKFVAWLIKKNMVPEKRKADLAAAIAASKKAPEKKPEAPAAQPSAAAPAAQRPATPPPAAQRPATPPPAAAPAAQ